jgi:type IV secretory pathway component VirB8
MNVLPTIVCFIIAFVVVYIIKSKKFRKFLIDIKNEIRTSYPVVPSIIEDIIFKSYDKVCE